MNNTANCLDLQQERALRALRALRGRNGYFLTVTTPLILLTDPLEVWLSEYEDGSFRRRFIQIYIENGKQSLVIVRENIDGSMFYNLIPVQLPEKYRYLDRQRAGFLLYHKEGE